MKTKNLFVIMAMTGLVAGCATPAKSSNPGTCGAKGQSCKGQSGCPGMNGCSAKRGEGVPKSNTAPRPFG